MARKSLVSVRAMEAGHVICEGDLTAKRPGTGIPAMEVDQLVGRKLVRLVAANVLLDWSDFV